MSTGQQTAAERAILVGIRIGLEYAATVCEGREKSNGDSGQYTAANEAGKCAAAVRYHERNLRLTPLNKYLPEES